MTAQTVLSFWFEEIEAKQWWDKSDDFDRLVTNRFGRYPHRNAILGRPSSAEELDFLATPGSPF